MKKFFKKVFKGVKKIVKPIGKALKKGLGKIGKALGPVGTLALSLMLPGIGAAWASFAGAGGLAATTGGVLGGVMKGIAAAGNAVGTVYSSVSSMVGSVVKAIPGVGDAYTKLSTFTTKMMDKGRMSMGLPTSSATTATKTAEAANTMSVDLEPIKVDTKEFKTKNLLDIDTNFNNKLPTAAPVETNILDKVETDLQMSDESFSQIIKDGKVPDAKVPDVTTQDRLLDVAKKPPAKAITSEDYLDKLQDPSSFTQIRSNVKVNQKIIGQTSVDDMSYDTFDVKTSALNEDQMKQINNTNTEIDYFNSQRDRILADAKLEDGSINPDYTEINKNMVGLKRGSAIASAASGTMDAFSMEEMEESTNPTVLPMLETEITGATDYSQAYASAFQGAGYVGPNDFNSYANAGYYGGDPFSIAQYNRRVPTPQANIRVGA